MPQEADFKLYMFGKLHFISTVAFVCSKIGFKGFFFLSNLGDAI